MKIIARKAKAKPTAARTKRVSTKPRAPDARAQRDPIFAAYEALKFVRPHRGGGIQSHWAPQLPSEEHIEARRYACSDGPLDRGTAEYGIGCGIGAEAAREYLSYLAKWKSSEHSKRLTDILFDMIPGLGRSNAMLLRGEIVGFFYAIDSALAGHKP
jgi:hypothetical protein